MPKKLHEIIFDILQKTNPLSVREITDIIQRQNLWRRPSDNALPEVEQISARINNYDHIFVRKMGLVQLSSNLSQHRLLRITWNENKWELPSGHDWRKKNQGNSHIAYENQYGYGGEEWLFNPRYNIDGYQYGYIRGLLEVASGMISKVYLFTINQKTKDRFLVGILKDVEVLNKNTLSRHVISVFKRHADHMMNEIHAVNGDTRNFHISDFYPPVRFKMSLAQLYEEPILINELQGQKYNRFKPYKIEGKLEELIAKIQPDRGFVFRPGKRKGEPNVYRRTLTSKSIEITELHKQMSKDIEQYLAPAYTPEKENISIEKTTFGNNIADVVLKEADNIFSIIEIKTSNNARSNIREALGQLLDYALWKGNIIIKKIIIVSPSVLKAEHLDYFKRLKASINISIEYWQYIPNAEVDMRFKEIA